MRSYIASKIIGVGLAVAATLSLSAPACATETTFASFSPAGSNPNVHLTNAGNGSGRLNDGSFASGVPTALPVQVKFSFLLPGISDFVTDVAATYTLTATIAKNTPAINAAGFSIQAGVGGTMSFISNTAILVTGPGFVPHNYAAGSNLLTVVFNSAALAGQTGSHNLSFSDGTLGGGTVTFTSDFLDFSNTTNRDFALSLSSLSPVVSAATGTNKSLNSFTGSLGGQFASDPAALVNGAVPEPATWAMMLLGMLGIGLSLRGRRRGGSLVSA
jgi:hypothetical protein